MPVAGLLFFVTLAEIIFECGELPDRSNALLSQWPLFINRAQRRIAQRRNFNFMHDVREVTIPTGYSTQKLGDDFKQLGEEESPVSFSYGNYRLPVKVTSRSRIEAAGIWPLQNGPFSLPTPGGYSPVQIVFIEQNAGGQWTINVPAQYSVTTPCTFNVSAFWYPTELKLGGDYNGMTTHGELCEALVNLTKALAYDAEAPGSPESVATMALFESAFENACYSDSAQKFNGRTLRM